MTVNWQFLSTYRLWKVKQSSRLKLTGLDYETGARMAMAMHRGCH